MGIARAEAVRLAKRVMNLDGELAENTKTIRRLLKQSAARVLLDKPGIGPVTAAVAMAAWSHDGRMHSEAAFASLAGVNPIPASSGNTVRHRLNRGGDRRLNKALHMAVIVRMTHDPETKTHVERRLAEGRTSRSGGGPTTLLVAIRRYRCTGCGHVWRQDTSKAAEPRARLSRRSLRWALQGLVCQHLTVARIAEGLDVSRTPPNDAVLAEGKRRRCGRVAHAFGQRLPLRPEK